MSKQDKPPLVLSTVLQEQIEILKNDTESEPHAVGRSIAMIADTLRKIEAQEMKSGEFEERIRKATIKRLLAFSTYDAMKGTITIKEADVNRVNDNAT